MIKDYLKQSYFLGISMGVFLSLFTCILLYKMDIINLDNSSNNKLILQLTADNERLKQSLLEKNTKIDELSKKSATILNKNKENADKTKVIVDIKEHMDNAKIADLLVQNRVYPYKNDLLMLLEMIKFNRTTSLSILELHGVISSASSLNAGLSELEKNQYVAAEYLYSNKKVDDKAAFMKIIYLLGSSTDVKYGKKEFKTNSSLREIGDVLISN